MPDAPANATIVVRNLSKWYGDVVAAHPAIRSEWEAFARSGGRLPLIEDMLGGDQGNVGGWWRTGALISRRRPRPPLAAHFPVTVATLLRIPGLLSAIWSVLGPGASLPVHTGVNAGALNLLVGVDCPPGSGHEIEGRLVSLDGGAAWFDTNMAPHYHLYHEDEGRLEDIDTDALKITGRPQLPKGATVRTIDVIIRVASR